MLENDEEVESIPDYGDAYNDFFEDTTIG